MKEIVLEYQLGLAVRSWLSKTFKGKVAPAKIPNAYNYNTSFSEEEIAVAMEKMTTLDLKDANESTINQLAMFPNLKYLSLVSSGMSKLSQESIEKLAALPNLMDVSIKGYSSFTTFDISMFPKLESVILVNNQDLETIRNLSTDLFNIECYGNRKLKNIRDVAYTALEIAKNDGRAVIDVCYAPLIFKKMEQYSTQFNNEDQYLENSLVFGDVIHSYDQTGNLGDATELKHGFNQIKLLNEKVQKISAAIIKPTDTTEEKFSALYGWICKNIQYDFSALENPALRHTIGSLNIEGKKINITEGLAKGTNSFVNGILYGECVCEGYAKALHYMCNYHNIKTSLVHCEIHSEGKKPEYHAILRYDEPPVRFCDPTWDAGAYQRGDRSLKYFMRTEEEIGKTHSRLTTFKDVRQTNSNIDRESLTRRAFDC